MSLKIKPKKKIRRRGDRLIITIGDRTSVYQDRGAWSYLVEFSCPDQHFTVEISPCEHYALMKGAIDGQPVQMVLFKAGGVGRTTKVAVREADASPWFFPDPDNIDVAYVSASQSGIKNVALLAAIITHEIDHDLAEFLKISPDMCPESAIEEFHENVRWRELLKFEFCIAPPTAPVGKGRRAENEFRHKQTNWDQMLKAGGGLLYPEQYETVRRGVDRLVAGALRKPVEEDA